MNRSQGKVALVTGGGGGIGSAISRELASEGAHVVVTDVNADDWQATFAVNLDAMFHL